MIFIISRARGIHKNCTNLRLGESQAGCELGSLGQRQVLGPLKPPVQLLQLQTAVDRPWLSHLLALAVSQGAASRASQLVDYSALVVQWRQICNEAPRLVAFARITQS